MSIQPRGKVERYVGYRPGLSEFHDIESTEIAAWSPGTVDEKLPAIQVHLIQKIRGKNINVVLRFKSPDTLGFLIEELTKYRREVWPDSEKVEGEK